MPFIGTKVNVKISKEQEKALAAALGKAITLLPGKTEQWLMLDFEDSCRLYFKGDCQKALAFVTVKVFGRLDAQSSGLLTAEITRVMKDVLGISPECVYVQYQSTDLWGWNGENL